MSPCGTRRVRAASRRKDGWTLGRFERPLVTRAVKDGVERLLAGGKGLERFEGMGEEESAEELSRLLRSALAPSIEAPLDVDLRAVGSTVFSTQAVYAHAWKRGEAILWDNQRMLHSTVPLASYRGERTRLMWQVICKCDEAWES